MVKLKVTHYQVPSCVLCTRRQVHRRTTLQQSHEFWSGREVPSLAADTAAVHIHTSIHTNIITYIQVWLMWHNITRLQSVIKDKNSQKCVLYETASKKFGFQVTLKASQWRQRRDSRRQTALFQTQDAAAAKQRSPIVEQRAQGMTSELVIADHRCRRESTSAVQRRLG